MASDNYVSELWRGGGSGVGRPRTRGRSIIEAGGRSVMEEEESLDGGIGCGRLPAGLRQAKGLYV